MAWLSEAQVEKDHSQRYNQPKRGLRGAPGIRNNRIKPGDTERFSSRDFSPLDDENGPPIRFLTDWFLVKEPRNSVKPPSVKPPSAKPPSAPAGVTLLSEESALPSAVCTVSSGVSKLSVESPAASSAVGNVSSRGSSGGDSSATFGGTGTSSCSTPLPVPDDASKRVAAVESASLSEDSARVAGAMDDHDKHDGCATDVQTSVGSVQGQRKPLQQKKGKKKRNGKPDRFKSAGEGQQKKQAGDARKSRGLRIRHPLPKNKTFVVNSEEYILYGNLESVSTAESTREHPPIPVRLDGLSRWSIDRSIERRGIWVRSTKAWYRLKKPSGEAPKATVSVEPLAYVDDTKEDAAKPDSTSAANSNVHPETSSASHGLDAADTDETETSDEDDDTISVSSSGLTSRKNKSGSSSARKLEAVLASQEEVHLELRAKFGLLSNILDLMSESTPAKSSPSSNCGGETDGLANPSKDVNGYLPVLARRSPVNIHALLSPNEEDWRKYNTPTEPLNRAPFDLRLLRHCPDFVMDHLSNFHALLHRNCAFMTRLGDMVTLRQSEELGCLNQRLKQLRRLSSETPTLPSTTNAPCSAGSQQNNATSHLPSRNDEVIEISSDEDAADPFDANKREDWTSVRYLRSAEEAERRGCRTPWGDRTEGHERIHPNHLIDIFIYRAACKKEAQQTETSGKSSVEASRAHRRGASTMNVIEVFDDTNSDREVGMKTTGMSRVKDSIEDAESKHVIKPRVASGSAEESSESRLSASQQIEFGRVQRTPRAARRNPEESQTPGFFDPMDVKTKQGKAKALLVPKENTVSKLPLTPLNENNVGKSCGQGPGERQGVAKPDMNWDLTDAGTGEKVQADEQTPASKRALEARKGHASGQDMVGVSSTIGTISPQKSPNEHLANDHSCMKPISKSAKSDLSPWGGAEPDSVETLVANGQSSSVSTANSGETSLDRIEPDSSEGSGDRHTNPKSNHDVKARSNRTQPFELEKSGKEQSCNEISAVSSRLAVTSQAEAVSMKKKSVYLEADPITKSWEVTVAPHDGGKAVAIALTGGQRTDTETNTGSSKFVSVSVDGLGGSSVKTFDGQSSAFQNTSPLNVTVAARDRLDACAIGQNGYRQSHTETNMTSSTLAVVSRDGATGAPSGSSGVAIASQGEAESCSADIARTRPCGGNPISSKSTCGEHVSSKETLIGQTETEPTLDRVPGTGFLTANHGPEISKVSLVPENEAEGTKECSDVHQLQDGHENNDQTDAAVTVKGDGGVEKEGDSYKRLDGSSEGFGTSIDSPRLAPGSQRIVTKTGTADLSATEDCSRSVTLPQGGNQKDSSHFMQPGLSFPDLDNKDWLVPVVEKDGLCEQFESDQKCDNGRNCPKAHVYRPKIPPRQRQHGDASLFVAYSKCMDQQLGLKDFYYKSSVSKGQEWYTAAFLCPVSRTIYHAAGGEYGHQSNQGVFWYRDRKQALEAVTGLVIDALWRQGLIQIEERKDELRDGVFRILLEPGESKGDGLKEAAFQSESSANRGKAKPAQLVAAPDVHVAANGSTSVAATEAEVDEARKVGAAMGLTPREREPFPVSEDRKYREYRDPDAIVGAKENVLHPPTVGSAIEELGCARTDVKMSSSSPRARKRVREELARQSRTTRKRSNRRNCQGSRVEDEECVSPLGSPAIERPEVATKDNTGVALSGERKQAAGLDTCEAQQEVKHEAECLTMNVAKRDPLHKDLGIVKIKPPVRTDVWKVKSRGQPTATIPLSTVFRGNEVKTESSEMSLFEVLGRCRIPNFKWVPACGGAGIAASRRGSIKDLRDLAIGLDNHLGRVYFEAFKRGEDSLRVGDYFIDEAARVVHRVIGLFQATKSFLGNWNGQKAVKKGCKGHERHEIQKRGHAYAIVVPLGWNDKQPRMRSKGEKRKRNSRKEVSEIFLRADHPGNTHQHVQITPMWLGEPLNLKDCIVGCTIRAPKKKETKIDAASEHAEDVVCSKSLFSAKKSAGKSKLQDLDSRQFSLLTADGMVLLRDFVETEWHSSLEAEHVQVVKEQRDMAVNLFGVPLCIGESSDDSDGFFEVEKEEAEGSSEKKRRMSARKCGKS